MSNNIKFEVTTELLEEMAQCIHNCSWVSADEVFSYMKACVTGSNDYDPENWSVNGRDVEAKSERVIESVIHKTKGVVK